MTPSSAALYSHRTPSGDGLSRLCACALIAAVTIACFWIYDRIAHRDSAYAPPLLLRAHALDYQRDRLIPSGILAPDMNSDAVRHANADVPVALQKPEQKAEPNQAKHAAAPHRQKKAPVIARRQSEPAMHAYALGPRTFQARFGSF
jgi:hypothetical protein